MLNGLLVILVENSTEALVLDTRKYPGRNIGEPDSERVVRGSRDGMTETLAINLALIRRKDKNRRFMYHHLPNRFNQSNRCGIGLSKKQGKP